MLEADQHLRVKCHTTLMAFQRDHMCDSDMRSWDLFVV